MSQPENEFEGLFIFNCESRDKVNINNDVLDNNTIKSLSGIESLTKGILGIIEKHGDSMNDIVWEDNPTLSLNYGVGKGILTNGIYVLLQNPSPTKPNEIKGKKREEDINNLVTLKILMNERRLCNIENRENPDYHEIIVYLRDSSHLSRKKPIISLNSGISCFKIFSTSFLE